MGEITNKIVQTMTRDDSLKELIITKLWLFSCEAKKLFPY